MAFQNEPIVGDLKVDRGSPAGNSPGADDRGRLHTKVSNKLDEAIPTTNSNINVLLSSISSEATQLEVKLILLDILSALSGGGGGLITQTISADYTVVDEDFILVVGSVPVTITVPAVYNKRLTIKNVSTEDVTIIPPSGFINGVPELKIRARRNPTYSEANLGNSVTLIYEGGQFWLV